MEKFKLDEQKLNSLKTYRDKGLRTVIGCVVALSLFTIWALSTVENEVKAETNENQKFVACFGCSHYDADTNSCIEWDKWSRWCEANFPTDTLEERDEWDWYPGKLNADWTSQEMPEIKGDDSHQRFKELCKAYWLDASKIWEVENKYWIKEAVILCIIVSETSWWHRWYWTSSCNNVWNVYNTDAWNRQCFNSYEEWLEAIWKTLNNKYLFNIWTLGCLSNAWSCKQWDNNWYRYATSNWNRERNMVSCLTIVYNEQIVPSDFIIRR